jgi:hypothetical protein
MSVLLLFPRVPQETKIVIDDAFNLAKVHRPESARPRHPHGVKPELRLFSFSPDVYMRWFGEIGLVEPEPKSSDTQNDRHMAPSKRTVRAPADSWTAFKARYYLAEKIPRDAKHYKPEYACSKRRR